MAMTFAEKVREIAEVAEEARDEGYITQWDFDFIADVDERLPFNPSPKQEDVVNRIYESICRSPL